ncbi:MAG: ATP-grasp domain-containing protein [Vicinamibacterales bacterium]
MKTLNILLTAASRRVALVQAFRQALRSTGVAGSVIVTDVNPLSPAVHVADRAYRVPMASDPEYLPEIMGICEEERIGLLVPTIDDELPIIGAARDRLHEAGTLVACSSEATSALCNDKHATCRHLAALGIPVAESWLPADLPAAPRLPLFIKPRTGRGAVSAFPVRSARELAFFLDYVPDPVVQEYLDGAEYTIDVLCDFAGRPLSIVPRERVVIRAGVIDRGRTVADRRLIELAERVCATVEFAGPLNIQCRMRGEQPVIFEINPRFSGGIPLTIQAGADFPRMLLRLAMGRPVEPAVGAFRDGLWMTSFESSFFLDGPDGGMRGLGRLPQVVDEVA